MLTYDKKQLIRLHRWLLPSVLFMVIVVCSRMDTLVEALTQTEALVFGWTLQFILESLQTETALLAAPIVCTFPFAAACIDEVKYGMLKYVLYRTDRNRYICSKVTASFAAGLLTLLIGVLLVFLLLFFMFYFRESPPEEGMDQYENIRKMIGICFRYSCFGGFWSLTGMWMSLLTMNRFMAWIGPFIVDFLLIILHERYFDGLLLFYPKQWIACTWEWPLGDVGVCLWMLLLSGIVFFMTMLTGRRLLERVA